MFLKSDSTCAINPFPPRAAKIGHFVILLCLTPDNFTRRRRASGWERVKSEKLFCFIIDSEEEETLDKEEEEEAIALQQHIAARLDEQDFDIEEFEVPEIVLFLF